MSDLMMAMLLSLTMVTANHFIPWMWFFRKGKPGLIHMATHLICLAIPLSGLFIGWGKYQVINQASVFARADTWLMAIWIMVGADLAMEFLLYMFDEIVAANTRADASDEEVDILRKVKLGAAIPDINAAPGDPQDNQIPE